MYIQSTGFELPLTTMITQTSTDDYYTDLHSDGQSDVSSQESYLKESLESFDGLCKRLYNDVRHERESYIRSKKATRKELRDTYVPCDDPSYIANLNSSFANFDSTHWIWGRYINIDLAILHRAFGNGYYEQVQQMVKDALEGWSKGLPKNLYLEIEDIWYESSYRLFPKKPYSELNPVDRYRIRKRNTCPLQDWVGGRKYKIGRFAREQLEEIYKNNRQPKGQVKQKVAEQTGLSYITISNWFKNRRQRTKVEPDKSGSFESKAKRLKQSAAVKIEKHSPIQSQCTQQVVSADATNQNLTTIHHRPDEHYLPSSGSSDTSQELHIPQQPFSSEYECAYMAGLVEDTIYEYNTNWLPYIGYENHQPYFPSTKFYEPSCIPEASSGTVSQSCAM